MICAYISYGFFTYFIFYFILFLFIYINSNRDIGPAVRVFANGPSHTKDFKNGTWYHLA